MMTETQSIGQASMGRLLLAYLGAAIPSAVVCLCIAWALARFADVHYPLPILLFLVPMWAAMQAGVSFFKQTGRPAGFGYSVLFGLLSTAMLIVIVLASWQVGYLDGALRQIDPQVLEQEDIDTIVLTLLALLVVVVLSCNVLLFWSSARAQLKQQERKARIEAEKADK